MEYSEYKKKRKEFLAKANLFLKDNKLDEAEKMSAEVIKLDSEYSASDSVEEHEKIIEQANYNALNGNVYSESLKLVGKDSIFENRRDKVKSIFINKNEKIEDLALEKSKLKLTEEQRNAIMNDGALSDTIRGMVTGNWENPLLKNAIGTSVTGTIIPGVLSAKIFDKAREKSLFASAGVPVIDMESNKMTISRVKTDPVFKFKQESEEGSEVDFELEGVSLESKTAYGYAYVSIEAIKSSKNLEDILYQVFSDAIASAIDKGFLYGQKTSSEYDKWAPTGIMNDTSICSLVAAENDGYDTFIKAIGRVKNENGNPTVVGMNSHTEETLSLLKTTDGQYLAEPKAIESMQKIVSNQLAYSEENGSDALVFDPQSLIIGLQENVIIKMIEDEKCLKNGLVGFQIYSMLDCKTVMPKHICKITGIK